MSKRSTSTKRKAAEMDASTAHSSAASFDISKLTESEQDKILERLQKDKKRREKNAKDKKKKATSAAEKRAEREFQATQEQTAKKRTAAESNAAARTTPANRRKKHPTGKHAAAVSSGDESGSDTASAPSAAGYESGQEAGIPIDPVLVDQDAGQENDQPARKRTKTSTGAAATITPVSKKTKGLPTITVSSSQALFKTPVGKQAAAAPEVPVSVDSSSDGESDTSDDEKRPVTIGPHTPYKAPLLSKGKNAPALRDLTPTTKALAEDLRTKYSVYLATEDAFPSEKSARSMARRLFILETDNVVHADELEEDEDADKRQRRGERAKADRTYRDHVNNLTTNVDSSFRGHVVEDAVGLVENEYELLDEDLDIADRVRQLLDNGAFTFKEWETRDGPFQCPILPKLIRKSFLTKQAKKGHALGLGPNFQAFSEVTPSLLAFLLTAIECVLTRWQTGKYDANHFTMAKYEPIYMRHLTALHFSETSVPGSLANIRKGIWTAACRSAGIDPPTQVVAAATSSSYMAESDLAKLQAAAQG